MRATRAVRWAVVCSVTAATVAIAATPASAVATDRWWGEDRHGTSTAASAATFTGHVDTVVVVNGDSFADALAAAPLAAQNHAPLLTVTADGIPAATRLELRRLAPKTIVVVGGAVVVKDGVVEELKGFAVVRVTRVSGTTRYDTARTIAERDFVGRTHEVFVASGENFPDALAAGAAGAAAGAPLVLTSKGELSPEARAAIAKLEPTRITIVGGVSVVSPAVEAELSAAYPGVVTRIAGDDRYDTAAKVLVATRTSVTKVLLASGTNFPDALAAAATGQPLLLSRPDCLPQATADVYARFKVTSVTGMGGTKVLSEAALAGTVCASAPTPTPTPSATATASPTASPTATASPSAGLTRPANKNCSDFSTWRAAQDWYAKYYPAFGDVAGLDRDRNGIACETLPGAPVG